MPPKRNQKSQKKEDAEREKKILSAKERVLAKKRFLLEIVEKMIEEDVSKEWFLSNCTYLCQTDFDDVTQERSIENLCGYPLCSNLIQKMIKQKYHISQVTNKVYDLSERKYFCCNHCYKASNYIKVQLSPIPLYMRKDEKIKVHLISDGDNKGSVGEEVLFHHKIPEDEIYKVYSEDTSSNLQNLLNEQVKKCADSLSGLQIKEHVFENQYVFSDETPNKSDNSALKSKSEEVESELDSDDSLDEKLFPSYDNESSLSNRHMPIPEKIKKSVLIPPQKSETQPTSRANNLTLDFVRKVFIDWMTESTVKYLMGEKYVYGAKADHLFKTMTESEPSSSEKLASIKNEYIKLCLKIDSLPDDDDIIDSSELDLVSKSNVRQTEAGNNSVKKVFKRRPKKSIDKHKQVTFAPKNDVQPDLKDEALCRQNHETFSNEKPNGEIELNAKKTVKFAIDKPDTNENLSSNNCDKLSSDKNIINEDEQQAEKTVKVSNREQSQFGIDETISLDNDTKVPFKVKGYHHVEQKNKENIQLPKVKESLSEADKTVSPNSIEEKSLPEDFPEPELEPTFPLVDSVSQNALRRKVLTNKLKSVYTEVLPIVGLYYTEIREYVRKFIDTLSLTPTNIIYKPKEWKLISLVLFRMLTRTVLKDMHDELQFAKLCEDPIMPIAVDLREIENLVCELISAENIISIH